MVGIFILSLDNSLILLPIEVVLTQLPIKTLRRLYLCVVFSFVRNLPGVLDTNIQFIDAEFFHSDSLKHWSAVLECL